VSGKLFVVATPLGNLDDLSPRALETLRSVQAVACEDTRRTGRLLARYGVEVPTVSCHRFNEQSRLEPILRRLRAGEDVALVSDGGTPGVADPGALLVRAALREGITVCPLPGPSAVATLLSASGLVAEWQAGAATDAFSIYNDAKFDNTATRLTPRSALTLRLPMSKVSATGNRSYLEPIVQLGWSDVTGDAVPGDGIHCALIELLGVKRAAWAMLMNERNFEVIHRDYKIRYFAIRTEADQRRDPVSDPFVVYEDSYMRIYDLAPL